MRRKECPICRHEALEEKIKLAGDVFSIYYKCVSRKCRHEWSEKLNDVELLTEKQLYL